VVTELLQRVAEHWVIVDGQGTITILLMAFFTQHGAGQQKTLRSPIPDVPMLIGLNIDTVSDTFLEIWRRACSISTA
jgi:hypothetical protein